jgi:hypothetical protein
MRKMRTILALAAVAALAIPAAASADVAVDDQGVGFVGKGDVQTLLGLNDAEMQSLFQTYPPQFGLHVVKTYDNYWECSDGSVHPYTTVVTANRPVDKTANTNNAGKLTNGWNLIGFFGTTHTSTVDNLPEGETFLVCPHGASVTGLRINDDAYSTVTSTPYVNGQLLPNTPVAEAA